MGGTAFAGVFRPWAQTKEPSEHFLTVTFENFDTAGGVKFPGGPRLYDDTFRG